MRRFFPIMIILLFSSCSVIREGVHITDESAKIESVQVLEGKYVNLPDSFVLKEFRGRSFSMKENHYLWNVFSTHKGKVDHKKWKESSVQIEFLTDKKAELSLLYEDSIIDSRKIRGKLKDGYFYKRPAFIIMPLFPFIFGYGTGRYRLGLNKDHSLIIEDSWNTWMLFFIAGSSTKAQAYSEFKRE